MDGFRLGRVLGFEISIDLSWLFILALVLWSFAAAVFPSAAPELSGGVHLAMSVVATLLFFACLVAHELAHSVVARSRGVEVEGITLFLFGGVSRMRDEARSPGDEFLIAAAGPLASIALAVLFWALLSAGAVVGWGTPADEVARHLVFLNLLLAGFNLLPGFPLDGGRLFRALLWWWRDDLEEATRWASRGGQLTGLLIAALGLAQLFAGNLIGGIWLGVIGWFLANAARTSYRHHVLRAALEGVTAADAMTPDPVAVRPDLRLEELVEERFFGDRHGAYPVVEDGRPVGIVTLGATGEVSRERWGGTMVSEVMTPLDEETTVRPEEDLTEVIRKLGESPTHRVLVVDDAGRLVGIVASRDITVWLALRAGRGMPADASALPVGRR